MLIEVSKKAAGTVPWTSTAGCAAMTARIRRGISIPIVWTAISVRPVLQDFPIATADWSAAHVNRTRWAGFKRALPFNHTMFLSTKDSITYSNKISKKE